MQEERFQFEVLGLAALAKNFGFEEPELARYLAQAGEPMYEDGTHRGVTEASWRRFVAESIRSRAEKGRTSEGPDDGPAHDNGVGDGHWGPERQEFFARHKDVAHLIEGFKVWLREREQVRLTQNTWTVTVMMLRSRLEAGLKPQAGGFYLYIYRGGKEVRCPTVVLSPADFEPALEWLRALPRYASAQG